MNNILVHKHLIVRAEAKNPPVDEVVLTEWFKKFIEEIGMKVMRFVGSERKLIR